MKNLKRINIGCGRTPTEGWLNMDNSVSLRLTRVTALVWIAQKLGVLLPQQLDNIAYYRAHNIIYCDARRHIPVADQSADVVYSSHMVEHLDQDEAAAFLRDVRRVLVSGGILRLALPNLRWHVDNYIQSGDGDKLMSDTKLGRVLPKSVLARTKVFFIGERRNHVWMYDPDSAVKLLVKAGFTGVVSLPSGKTGIQQPGALNLSERSPESLFVEGVNP